MGREDLGPSISGGRGNGRGDLATKPILTPSHLDPAIHEGAVEGEGRGCAFGVGIVPGGEICGGRDTGGDAWRACGMSDPGRELAAGEGVWCVGRGVRARGRIPDSENGARAGSGGWRVRHAGGRRAGRRGHGDAVDALTPLLRCSRDIV
jgi:hypothetical protein